MAGFVLLLIVVWLPLLLFSDNTLSVQNPIVAVSVGVGFEGYPNLFESQLPQSLTPIQPTSYWGTDLTLEFPLLVDIGAEDAERYANGTITAVFSLFKVRGLLSCQPHRSIVVFVSTAIPRIVLIRTTTVHPTFIPHPLPAPHFVFYFSKHSSFFLPLPPSFVPVSCSSTCPLFHLSDLPSFRSSAHYLVELSTWFVNPGG
jgi:hypothetical protein